MCELGDCAQSVLASIVGTYDDYIVVDAGALALSQDLGSTHIEPNAGYGRILRDYDANIEYNEYKIKSLSQEHGKISVGSSSTLRSLSSGERLRIITNHSCLTQYMYDKFYLVEKDKVVDIWKIHRDRLSILFRIIAAVGTRVYTQNCMSVLLLITVFHAYAYSSLKKSPSQWIRNSLGASFFSQSFLNSSIISDSRDTIVSLSASLSNSQL